MITPTAQAQPLKMNSSNHIVHQEMALQINLFFNDAQLIINISFEYTNLDKHKTFKIYVNI
jgi:hypothetical protein